jgi:hypothetical protein
MDDYITSLGYENMHKICFGVSMEKNDIDNTYEYHLKFNTTINYNENNLPDIPGNENGTRVENLRQYILTNDRNY